MFGLARGVIGIHLDGDDAAADAGAGAGG